MVAFSGSVPLWSLLVSVPISLIVGLGIGILICLLRKRCDRATTHHRRSSSHGSPGPVIEGAGVPSLRNTNREARESTQPTSPVRVQETLPPMKMSPNVTSASKSSSRDSSTSRNAAPPSGKKRTLEEEPLLRGRSILRERRHCFASTDDHRSHGIQDVDNSLNADAIVKTFLEEESNRCKRGKTESPVEEDTHGGSQLGEEVDAVLDMDNVIVRRISKNDDDITMSNRTTATSMKNLKPTPSESSTCCVYRRSGASELNGSSIQTVAASDDGRAIQFNGLVCNLSRSSGAAVKPISESSVPDRANTLQYDYSLDTAAAGSAQNHQVDLVSPPKPRNHNAHTSESIGDAMHWTLDQVDRDCEALHLQEQLPLLKETRFHIRPAVAFQNVQDPVTTSLLHPQGIVMKVKDLVRSSSSEDLVTDCVAYSDLQVAMHDVIDQVRRARQAASSSIERHANVTILRVIKTIQECGVRELSKADEELVQRKVRALYILSRRNREMGDAIAGVNSRAQQQKKLEKRKQTKLESTSQGTSGARSNGCGSSYSQVAIGSYYQPESQPGSDFTAADVSKPAGEVKLSAVTQKLGFKTPAGMVMQPQPGHTVKRIATKNDEDFGMYEAISGTAELVSANPIAAPSAPSSVVGRSSVQSYPATRSMPVSGNGSSEESAESECSPASCLVELRCIKDVQEPKKHIGFWRNCNCLDVHNHKCRYGDNKTCRTRSHWSYGILFAKVQNPYNHYKVHAA